MAESAHIELPRAAVGKIDRSKFFSASPATHNVIQEDRLPENLEFYKRPIGERVINHGDPDEPYFDAKKFNTERRRSQINALKQIVSERREDKSIVPVAFDMYQQLIRRGEQILRGGKINPDNQNESQELYTNLVELSKTFVMGRENGDCSVNYPVERNNSLVHQELSVTNQWDKDKLLRTQLKLVEQNGSQLGVVVIDLDQDSNTDTTNIVSQTGIFENLSFTEAADNVIEAANNAAQKFEVDARKLDATLNKFE